MSLLLERLAEHGSVPLEGYGHQVGGHFLLMKFKDAAICKPLIQREHFFYETLPEDLKLFLPAYYGVIKVAFERQSSGDIQMVAYPEGHSQTEPSCQTTKIDNYSLKASTGKSIHVGETSILSKGVAGGDSYVNPWSKECAKNTTNKLKQFGSQLEGLHQDYMVLENLTSKFSSPSILDLKVGTRQHGDDIPEAKKLKHMKTVAESTSSTLGVRICGMQKFDASKNEYLFRDKYYGRSLDDEGFYQELQTFLHNGVCFRSDLIPRLLSMVQELRRVIKRQGSYRFYSSSLLIIYDGAVTPELLTSNRKEKRQGDAVDPGLIEADKELRLNEEGEGDVQHKDGGGSERKGEVERRNELEHDTPSLGVAEEKGESVLSHKVAALPDVRTFESSALLHVNPTAPFRMQHHFRGEQNHHMHTCCCHDNHKTHPPGPPQTQQQETKLLTCTASTSNHHVVKNGYHPRHHAHQPSEAHYISKADLEKARKSVELRMIDFAHSTHRGYNDKVQYSGPDEGYVLGVSSLVTCFERMLSESTL